jgi:small-conductance mechanosensitive channel
MLRLRQAASNPSTAQASVSAQEPEIPPTADTATADTGTAADPGFTLFPGRVPDDPAHTDTGGAASTLLRWSEDLGFGEVAGLVHRVMNFPIFEVGGTAITLTTVLVVGVLIILTWWVSNLLQRAIDRTFRARGITDVGTMQITKRLMHYAVMALGLSIAITQVGINLNALFAAGAIFAVGIGFAMQNIAQNFVSGLILLIERAIKPGDILEVEGRVVRVLKMGIRTTIARTRDDEEIIIPNATLVQSTVTNYTLDDPIFRVRADVGVHYASDMRAVREALLAAAGQMEWRLRERDPVILITDFGDSSVDWQVSLWCDNAWTAPRVQSELREAIWWALKEADIEIAYPQVDVHFDRDVSHGLARMAPTLRGSS